uniref:Uncharacterized protein n=1 Tax=viral metagenome TaxID=1070528 RepID=A0A6C0HRU7_9ZZZZ
MDTNVKNYSVEELTEILGLTYPARSRDIIVKTNEYIKKYTKKENEEMINFFEEVQSILVENNDNREIEKSKGSQNVYNVPVQKDVLNPLLKNVTTRIVNIDSQFRDYTFEDSLFQTSTASYSLNEYSSSYFNANLCEQLTNVLSIKMENIIIPKTWYTIDSVYNNNFFWITTHGEDYFIVLRSGNYTPVEFVAELEYQLAQNNFFGIKCIINPTSSRLSFTFDNPYHLSGTEKQYFVFITGESFIGDLEEEALTEMLDTYAYFTFYDIGNLKYYKYTDSNGKEFSTNLCLLFQPSIDATLGWLMGFRSPYLFMKSDGNTASVSINLSGTQYFSLVLEDYQTNRVNNDIITLTGLQDSRIDLPKYINASLLYKCIKLKNNVSIKTEKSIEDFLFNQTKMSNKSIPQFIPSAPRILTQTQLYATNQIIRHNRGNPINCRLPSPTTNDVLAIIPVNTQGVDHQNLFIQDKLQTNTRLFFGPVNIDRFTVRLINDKGQLVNLNGGDWSFTLKIEVLYQI